MNAIMYFNLIVNKMTHATAHSYININSMVWNGMVYVPYILLYENEW